MKYPVRCQIVDIAGSVVHPDYPDIVAATPEVSKPYVGEFGLAEYEAEMYREYEAEMYREEERRQKFQEWREEQYGVPNA